MKKPFLVFFQYSKQQQLGVLIFLALIILVQILCFTINPKAKNETVLSAEELTWMRDVEATILREQHAKETYKIQPFNPNFISEYKAYQLHIPLHAIQKLNAFRAKGKFVNSAIEFQKITGIHDTLLQQIQPYFKFPDWIKNRFSKTKHIQNSYFKKEKTPLVIKDINNATLQDLEKVNGIGTVLAGRIMGYKNQLGAFVKMEQLSEVWGLSEVVLAELFKSFKIIQATNVKKIKINDASIKELQSLPYFSYPIAKAIVAHRSMQGDFNNIEDLRKVKNFPVEKIDRIVLYLDFQTNQ